MSDVRTTVSIDPSMTVRDIIQRHPATFAVFMRHGLMGCGGPQGPVEPVAYFARVHGVDPDALLADLEAAAASGDVVPAEESITPQQLARENLYRRFLKAALLFTFTGGAALGAWALIAMAIQGRLGGIGRGIIQVHGHWQLFGWVGLFVVGIAYHILPRLAAVPLPSYPAAAASFALLVAGTVLRAAQSLDPSAIRSTLLIGGALMELAGCALFAWTVTRILGASPGIALGRAPGSCEVDARSTEAAMGIHRQRGATRQAPATPMRPQGSGGVAPSASLPLLRDGTPSRRRGASRPTPRRSERDPTQYPDRLPGPQSGPGRNAFSYLALGSAWLIAAAFLNLAHAWHLVARSTFEIPAFWNLPYLSIFLLGFVTFWIFGVSLRTLPLFMGLKARPDVTAALLLPLTASLAALAIGESLFVAGRGAWSRWLFGAGGLGTGLCLVLFVWAIGIMGRREAAPEPGVDHGYEKFLRLGYAWLLISAGMLVVFSAFVLTGRSMDHAYVGAYRHALTVGFITTVIVGMASRIVPVFRGVPLYSARLREWSFWLLLVGNIVRVLFQSLSASGNPIWLRVAGVSGILELAALGLFGVNLWKTMDATTVEETVAAGWRPPIAPETRVGELLAAYPGLLPVFVRNGFGALANPVLRRTVARVVSVGEACRMHGVDLQSFLAQLSEARARLGA